MNKLKTIFFFVISLLCLSVGFVSCSDEDDGSTYPSLLSEFVDVCTDEFGAFNQLLTDNGESLYIVNSAEIKAEGVIPDTVYRAISRYEIVGGGVKLYSLQAIHAPKALPIDSFPEGVKFDAVEMQSVWRGGDYLNLILLVKALNGGHSFHFIEDSITSSPVGVNTLHLRLAHDAGDDVQAYTQKAYLSVPLQPYATILSGGDTIEISIPTALGWEIWKREF